jgi:hypothetical protein
LRVFSKLALTCAVFLSIHSGTGLALAPFGSVGQIATGRLSLKRNNARIALVSRFLGLGVVTQGQAEDYYIYHDPNGKLVISNKAPPPGSKIIKQLPDLIDREVPQAQEPGKTQPNVQTEGSPKPSNNK